MEKHTIWDSNGWFDLLKDEDFISFVKENHPDIYEDEYELDSYAIDVNNDYLEDERANLDFPCDMLAVGGVRLWNRTVSGYQILHNLNECFDASGVNGDFTAHIYVDKETSRMYGSFAHHDAPMGYTLEFFIVKDDVEDDFFDRLFGDENLTIEDLERNCYPAGIKVREIYGF